MALLEDLGWTDVDILRQPSGDGAIIAFFGQGVDAASMVEPYATMLETMGVGYIARRTGDIWPGAPGCSLTTTAPFAAANHDLVVRVVRAFTRAATFVQHDPKATARIAHQYIGISPDFIERALLANRPNIDAIRNVNAMLNILELMKKLGYLTAIPTDFYDLKFLDEAARTLPTTKPELQPA
jgi:ABC-type nitrate/sulfonate/bicarbonate transport system substrate-binding protein